MALGLRGIAAGKTGSASPDESGAQDANALASATKVRVLLVDDDDAVRVAFRRVLERRGFSVFPCCSGQEALDRLASGSFDAMVSDVRMPGMSGLKLLRAVREHDLDLPVILVTGNPDVDSASEAVEYGAFKYLIKPVESEHLGQVLERAATVGRMARVKREYVEEFGSATFRVGDRAGISAVLERALGSLWVAYQPIVKALDYSLFAHEVLMRSNEPDLPHPGAVLKAAERVERVHDVGAIVRSLALDGLERDAEGVLFVNLHPQDLKDDSLYAADAPFSRFAQRIVLEITERASLEHIRDLRERVAALRALGFRIALDDLGAGYAGLTSFAQLEPEFVKLDMELIRDIHSHAMKQKIVRSMVRLCHDMGKAIIGEGVECSEEAETLLELECDYLQGFFFAKPGKAFPSLAVAPRSR
ncbi:MAG TPA: EAL domain-containing response regulator [Polyangiaceae bacterium]|jgi:EAL domain-containing protein (putative c-di-GMP-specific phosphodiesterase class I)/CheY-like chemotaxis protein